MVDTVIFQYMVNENQSAQILHDPYSREHPGIFCNSFHEIDIESTSETIFWRGRLKQWIG